MALAAGAAHADEGRTGGKLRLTRGISTIEGQGGGGLTAWALIAGDETNRGIGATAHVTGVQAPDYSFLSYGVALGLSNGFRFNQDVYGAKVRLLGDAVGDQDT